MNEEAIAYWESHGCTVPSPAQQAAMLQALQAQIAELTTKKPARRSTPRPPVTETATSSYETVAINATAMATTTRLMELPELARLSREQVYLVVEAFGRGLAARQIRTELHWGSEKYSTIITPVIAAVMRHGTYDPSPLPLPSNTPVTAKRPVAATRTTTPATRQRKTVTHS
jgi:hypothetical protein